MSQRPEEPERVMQITAAAAPAGLPFTWRPNPPLIDDETREQVRSLPRHQLTFEGWTELPPNGIEQKDPAWNGRPTRLSERFIRAPWGSTEHAVLLLWLRPSLEDAIQAAAKRVPSSRLRMRRTRVQRYIVQVEGNGVDVVDGRSLEQLTDVAVLNRTEQAWGLLETMRLEGDHGVLIKSVTGADALLIFARTLGATLVERDAAIYAVDRDARFEREPIRKHPLERWVIHVPVALAAAIVAHPATEMLGQLAGVTIRIPVALPVGIALVGLAAIEARRRK